MRSESCIFALIHLCGGGGLDGPCPGNGVFLWQFFNTIAIDFTIVTKEFILFKDF